MLNFKKSKISLVLVSILALGACTANIEKVEDRKDRLAKQELQVLKAENKKNAKAVLDELKDSKEFHQSIFNESMNQAKKLGIPLPNDDDWAAYIESENLVFRTATKSKDANLKTLSLDYLANIASLEIASSKLYTDGALKAPITMTNLSDSEKNELLVSYENAMKKGFTGSKEDWYKAVENKAKRNYQLIDGLSRIEQGKRIIAQEFWSKSASFRDELDEYFAQYNKEGNYDTEFKVWFKKQLYADKVGKAA